MCTAIREIKEMAVQQGIQLGRKEQTEKNILYCFTSFKQLAPGLSDENIIQKLADDYHMSVDIIAGLVQKCA